MLWFVTIFATLIPFVVVLVAKTYQLEIKSTLLEVLILVTATFAGVLGAFLLTVDDKEADDRKVARAYIEAAILDVTHTREVLVGNMQIATGNFPRPNVDRVLASEGVVRAVSENEIYDLARLTVLADQCQRHVFDGNPATYKVWEAGYTQVASCMERTPCEMGAKLSVESSHLTSCPDKNASQTASCNALVERPEVKCEPIESTVP